MRWFHHLLFPTLALVGTLSPVHAAGMMGDGPAIGTSVGTIEILSGLSRDEVRDIVAFSLAARSWTVKEKGEQRVVGYLKHRGREATLTFLPRAEVIEIFCDGYRLSRSGERTNPDIPHGWIDNLKKDIPKRMSMKVATK